MNTQLLCLFTTKEELDKSVNFILTNYTLTNPNVFILESKIRPEEAFTVAMAVLLLDQVPPVSVELNEVVNPIQID